MNTVQVEDKDFHGADFTHEPLPMGHYDNCTFDNCTFAGLDLSGSHFSECRFGNCDLSGAQLADTALKNVIFKDCKLLGLPFFECSDFLFAVSFENCQLDMAAFYKRDLKGTSFSGCSLKEADFTESNLTEAVFEVCDLQGAIFENTVLEKADLRTAAHYTIDPERNRISKAKFSLPGVLRLLDKYNIEIDY